MRTTLAPSLTQQWVSLGLGSWHYQIAKREASRIGLQTNGVVIQWKSMEIGADSMPTLRLPLGTLASSGLQAASPLPAFWSDRSHEEDGPQVVLVARASVELALQSWLGQESSSRSVFCQRTSTQTVFLLWDWGPSGRASLGWATSLGFAGVIFDFSTLRSWTRVAVDRLPTKLKELHPLVATLPTLPSAHRQS
ncbi:MAG: hypothetical protein ACK5PB_19845 [Pirellula sp.]|jgi:hypothetical protein